MVRLELEATPRAYVMCGTLEEEYALLRWLEANPAGVAGLLDRVVRAPAELFPWLGTDARARAEEASRYVPAHGKFAEDGEHGPRTLGEILDLGDAGERWLRWALVRVTWPLEYREAVWAFSAVYAPALHVEATSRGEEAA